MTTRSEEGMKVLLAGGALLAAAIAIAGTTSAQAQNAPVYQYCLLERMGGPQGPGEMMTCRYTTLAQCMASKSGNADTCIINPQLTFPRR
jgi:hypothetical protein